MRIEEIDGVKYHVVKVISSESEQLVNSLSERYKEQHKDFVLLKKVGTAGVVEVEPHYLLCRKIDDADYDEG